MVCRTNFTDVTKDRSAKYLYFNVIFYFILYFKPRWDDINKD